MPIVEIIAEIDTYLFRLRQARKLLLDRRMESQPKSVPRKAGGTDSHAGRHRGDAHGSRSKQAGASPKTVAKRPESDAQVPIPTTAASVVATTEQPTVPQPERAIVQSIVVTRVPARRRTGSVGSKRDRTPKPDSGAKPDPIKPAIALAGPVRTKIVVVSPEQKQREREQAANPQVQRPRTPISGLSGRRAFEALFPD